MRSAVLILLPIALLAAAFYLFVVRVRPAPLPTSVAQTSAGPTTRKFVPTTMSNLDPSASVIGKSGNVWVQSLNRKTRKVSNEFRSERFDPRPDGAVDVTFPQARFYGEDGGIVTLEGSGGKVSLSQPGDRKDPQAMGSSTPTDGDLKDVIIRFYDSSLEDEPSMVAQLPAVHFDAIGNRVTTVDCVIEGKGVTAEQVPVTVRGRDFEFDGYGLTMSWSDRGGRLESLEVNRGERLLIKNLQKFNIPSHASAAPAATNFFASSPADLFVGLLAQSSTEPVMRRQMYYATFDHDVRVNRDDKQLAAADVMRVILPLGDAKAQQQPEAPPTEENRAQRARRRAAATAPASEHLPVEDSLGVRKPATRAAKSTTRANTATTQPEQSPIEVLWTGKLTVRPVERIPDLPRDPGQMVELIGAPAWVEENGSHADARLIHVEPDSGLVRLEPGGAIKTIAVHDARGADLRTRSVLLANRHTGIVTVNGGGTLTAPAKPPEQPDDTTITWARRLTLNMTNSDQPVLKGVTIEGEAKVVNPQLNVTSDTLKLGFAEQTKHEPAAAPATADTTGVTMPSADMSALRTVVATGDAVMIVGNDAATRRTLGAQKIDLGFVPLASGAGLHTIKCDQAVNLTDAAGMSLTCANLDATVKPTAIDRPTTGPATNSVTSAQTSSAPHSPANNADPLADLDALTATGAVSLKQADGSSAFGDRVVMTREGDVKHMTLTGAPANVASPRGTLEGDRILIDPAAGDVNVPGPGRFVGTGEAKSTTQPASKGTMAVAWLESMNTVGETGVCDLVGGVRIDGTSAAGTHLKASSQRGRINFTPRQTSSAATKPAMADASLDSIRSVQLAGAVDVAMEAVDVRTSSMQTEQVNIDLENSTVTAPQPGRLLVLDGHPATTRPTTASTTSPSTLPTALETAENTTQSTTQSSTQPATATTLPAKGKSGPGSLAIAWKHELLWKMREGQLTFDGGVRLGYEKADSNGPIRLTSERVICALSPVQTGKGVDQLAQRIDLRTMTAEQNVSVRSKLASFDSASLTFDAVTNRATAVGDAETPVEVFDADGTSRVGFSAITWNLDTGMIEDFRDIDGRLRR